MLVGPSKCLKRIIQIELNRVKNPNWPEANQLAILQAWTRIWTRDYREQIQLAVRAGLELGASELQVQRSKHSATLPLKVEELSNDIKNSIKFGIFGTNRTVRNGQVSYNGGVNGRGGEGGGVLDWDKVDVDNWGMENDSTTISFFHDKTVLRTGYSILSKSP